MGDTIRHNLNRKQDSPSRFEGRATDNRLTPKQAALFQEFIQSRGQAFLEEVDDWLTEHEPDDPPAAGTAYGLVSDYLLSKMMPMRRNHHDCFFQDYAAVRGLTCAWLWWRRGRRRPAASKPAPPTGGIDRGGFLRGTLTAFGSVIVNGVEMNTDSASFTLDDSPGSQSDLRIGQVIVVTGEIDDNKTTGTADAVVFNDNVEGPVQSIDEPNNSLVVLGQTVRVSADTSFDDRIVPASLAGLGLGDIVEVSGLVAADGSIAATRIETKLPGGGFQVRGTVADLDTNAFSFRIGGLSVDYSGATLDNFPAAGISDQDFVEVKGDTLGAGGDLLIATRVELENVAITGDEGLRVQVEGLITGFASATDFDVSGTPVTTNGGTVFEGGVAQDLGLNVKVEVEGELDAAGVLIADKVDIRRAKVVRITADVDSANGAANTLVMLGITIRVDALTRLEDKSGARVSPFTVGDINAGDYVEVRGGDDPASSGDILATILERDDADTEAILQGFVESVISHL